MHSTIRFGYDPDIEAIRETTTIAMPQEGYMRLLSLSLACASLMFFAGCASQEDLKSASQEVKNQDEVIKKLRDENNELRADFDELSNQYELSKLELARLREAANLVGEVGSLKDQLENIKKRFGNIEGVEVHQRPDGTALTVKGSVLFRTGSDEISDRGKEVLLRVAEELRKSENSIRVEGHTDNVPVQRTIQKYPKGNLELSGERALNVAHFLVTDGGIERTRLCYAGYGPERPVADNGSDDGRSQNRRVEIVILN